MPRAKKVKSESPDEGKPYSKPAKKPAAKSKNPTNRKQGAWSAEELRALYEYMCPKRVSYRHDASADARWESSGTKSRARFLGATRRAATIK